MNKKVRESYIAFNKLAGEYDCIVSLPEQTGNSHFKWVVEHISGHSLKMLTSQSPSDRRVGKQRASVLKKLCRHLQSLETTV